MPLRSALFTTALTAAVLLAAAPACGAEDAAFGYVHVFCQPGVQVFLDEENVGVTDAAQHGLILYRPVGTYTLRLSKAGAPSRSAQVVVLPDMVVPVRVPPFRAATSRPAETQPAEAGRPRQLLNQTFTTAFDVASVPSTAAAGADGQPWREEAVEAARLSRVLSFDGHLYILEVTAVASGLRDPRYDWWSLRWTVSLNGRTITSVTRELDERKIASKMHRVRTGGAFSSDSETYYDVSWGDFKAHLQRERLSTAVKVDFPPMTITVSSLTPTESQWRDLAARGEPGVEAQTLHANITISVAAKDGLVLPEGPDPAVGPAAAPGGLAGTVWEGKSADGKSYFFRFLAGGALRYTDPAGTFTNGSWTQNGQEVYLEMNNRYVEYRGTRRGDQIEGVASNKAKAKWNFSVGLRATPTSRPAAPVPAATSRPASPVPTPSAAGGLESTVWAGTDSDGDYYVFRFNRGGLLQCTNSTSTNTTGTWRQDGSRVILSISNGYSTYTGTLAGDTIEGTATNKAKHTWRWSVKKQ